MDIVFLLPRARRPRRGHEWSVSKAVTFIVTLAATRNVTFAARAAGMSRKSAYALRKGDRGFASAWDEALRAGKGNKVDEVEDPPIPPMKGNSGRLRGERRRDSPDGLILEHHLCSDTYSSGQPCQYRHGGSE